MLHCDCWPDEGIGLLIGEVPFSANRNLFQSVLTSPSSVFAPQPEIFSLRGVAHRV